MANSRKVAQEILDILGKENIISFTNCMTRLRVKLHNDFDQNKLKEIDGVLGLIVAGDENQIVLGPGFVNKVTSDFSKLTNLDSLGVVEESEIEDKELSAAEIGKFEKDKLRSKNKNGGIRTFLSKISKVFAPLIPAFIGAGLLSGIAGIISSSVDGNFTNHLTLQSWYQVLSIMMTILANIFIIAVGWNIGKEWGGNPGLTALVAAIFTTYAGVTIDKVFIPIPNGTGYNFMGLVIPMDQIKTNWLTVGFIKLTYTPAGSVASIAEAHAGLIGAMMAAGICVQVEKVFRKFMPGAIDTIVTPIIVILIMVLLNFFLIIPIAGYLFTGVAWLFEKLYANPFGAAFLAGIFLITVVFGVHQGFLPVYFALIAETGINGLFPILCMGGVAQVGVAIGMWFLAEKGSKLRRQIAGAIIPGFLGIGEPLIYGIALPRVKPFFVSCIASGIAGFYMGALNTWGGLGVGMSAPTGPGGLVAAIMMTTKDNNVVLGIGVYLSAILVGYLAGFGLCLFSYSKISRSGIAITKSIYKSKNILNITLITIGMISIIGIVPIWTVFYTKMNSDLKQQIIDYKLI